MRTLRQVSKEFEGYYEEHHRDMTPDDIMSWGFNKAMEEHQKYIEMCVAKASHSSQLSEKEQRIQELEKVLRAVESWGIAFGSFNGIAYPMHQYEALVKQIATALSPNLGEPKETTKDE